MGRFDDKEKALDLNEKGVELSELERYEESIACCDQLIKLNPEFQNAKGNMLFDKLQKYEEALVCFDEVIRFNPKNSDGWYNKGKTLKKNTEILLKK